MATTAARPCCGLASAGLAGTDTAIFSYRVGAFLASRSDEKLLGVVFCDGCSQLERLRCGVSRFRAGTPHDLLTLQGLEITIEVLGSRVRSVLTWLSKESLRSRGRSGQRYLSPAMVEAVALKSKVLAVESTRL
jgi:hypothetical protein